uniref:Cytochrome b n=1 Tax=Crassicauda sp. Ningbo-2019 TaxID=2860933 RepID=A0A8F6U4E9_9BILA|nr:cytochrome b [Crassicauda sp. Ningbo-2019]WHL46734.1 cytochrome b [Crassicauda magna]
MGFLKSGVYLPSSYSLSYLWNFGSMLGIMLMSQIFTGFFLTFYYSSAEAFQSIQYIMYDVDYGWLFRVLHSNGASMFFFCIYIHIFKGLYMSSYRLKLVWISGVIIYFFLMGIAFTGYVLVWAQMSYWAAVVITSLMTSVPYLGKLMVLWIWGGYSVCLNTLKFFYSVHFILPWVLMVIVMVHLIFLHYTGSSSSLYCHGDYDKIHFFPGFWLKDLVNICFFFIFLMFAFYYPFKLSDPMMFLECDIMASPAHVVPEWYFLFAFTILRSIPSKLLGVVFMFSSIFFLMALIFPYNYYMVMDNFLFFFVSIFVWSFFWLTWAGCYPTDYPFNVFNFVFTMIYFGSLVFMMIFNWLVKVFFS